MIPVGIVEEPIAGRLRVLDIRSEEVGHRARSSGQRHPEREESGRRATVPVVEPTEFKPFA
ncbi:MAG: hypothetical protein C0467_30565 [Planctomycetaceae bacterium]|nr:hypothetical protein [Planctomycetaceae bacterium]